MRATRSELLRIRERVKLARKGKDILKKKLDSLVNELYSRIGRVKRARKEFLELLKEAEKIVKLAIAFDSLQAVRSASLSSELEVELSLKEKNVMGVVIPEISYEIKKGAFGSLAMSSRIIEAREKFVEVIEKAVPLVEQEFAVRRILEEIERTKRRVNALERKIIPELEENMRFISMKLDEMEREDFVRLKKIMRR